MRLMRHSEASAGPAARGNPWAQVHRSSRQGFCASQSAMHMVVRLLWVPSDSAQGWLMLLLAAAADKALSLAVGGSDVSCSQLSMPLYSKLAWAATAAASSLQGASRYRTAWSLFVDCFRMPCRQAEQIWAAGEHLVQFLRLQAAAASWHPESRRA